MKLLLTIATLAVFAAALAYRKVGRYNIIICDYEKYAAPYLSAVSNAKDIGAKAGQFISFLLGQGLVLSTLHLIGHSLGAHIAGFASNNIPSKISYITGLDAASPLYENSAPENCLSKDDAIFVAAVHTSNGLGKSKAYGTADFYVNGGSNQPTCAEAAVPGGCDHAASYRTYCETITNKKSHPAKLCKTESDAKEVALAASACTFNGAYMGDDAVTNAPPGVYFV